MRDWTKYSQSIFGLHDSVKNSWFYEETAEVIIRDMCKCVYKMGTLYISYRGIFKTWVHNLAVILYLRIVLKVVWTIWTIFTVLLFVFLWLKFQTYNTNTPVSNWDVHFHSKYRASHRFIHYLLAAFTEVQSFSPFFPDVSSPICCVPTPMKTTIFICNQNVDMPHFRKWAYFKKKM